MLRRGGKGGGGLEVHRKPSVSLSCPDQTCAFLIAESRGGYPASKAFTSTASQCLETYRVDYANFGTYSHMPCKINFILNHDIKDFR